jgi:hypothetical protein
LPDQMVANKLVSLDLGKVSIWITTSSQTTYHFLLCYRVSGAPLLCPPAVSDPLLMDFSPGSSDHDLLMQRIFSFTQYLLPNCCSRAEMHFSPGTSTLHTPQNTHASFVITGIRNETLTARRRVFCVLSI